LAALAVNLPRLFQSINPQAWREAKPTGPIYIGYTHPTN
jgi:hypothetical protein